MKLEEGEMICDKCGGKGGNSFGTPSGDLTKPQWVRCQKCQGEGKVDWVENIMGKAPQQNHGTSSSSSFMMGGTFAKAGTSGQSPKCLISDDVDSPVDFYYNGEHSFLTSQLLDKMGKEIADSIDKEILESIMGDLEQTNNKMKAAAAVMNEIGGPAIDNGIISKFMLFFATKPEVKAQENRCLISRCS